MPTLVDYWTDVVRHIFNSSSERFSSPVIASNTPQQCTESRLFLLLNETFYYINRFLKRTRGEKGREGRRRKRDSPHLSIHFIKIFFVVL